MKTETKRILDEIKEIENRVITVDDFKRMINHCLHFGDNSIIKKDSRGWTASCGKIVHPQFFQTKKEAADAVSIWLCDLGNFISENEGRSDFDYGEDMGVI